ncbi:MAG: GerW family sporulation protein [Christensenellales bacterium]
MEQHPIENIMHSTMTNIKDMVDVNTIVGDSVVMADGTVIIPVSRIGFGFVSGGGEYPGGGGGSGSSKSSPEYGKEPSHLPFAGGSGAGVSVSPVAFLVAGNGKVQLLPVETYSPLERVIDIVPGIVSDIRAMFCRDEAGNDTDDEDYDDD